MNTYGENIRLTTWGESHGKAIGGVIDGYPAGVKIDFEAIEEAMAERRPGRDGVSMRKETDRPEFLSGISEEGVTLGTPIAFLIRNEDSRSHDYDILKDKFRPNHADYTYQAKYGIRDWRGGGRASARETACRVVAGALAMQILDVEIRAWLTGAGEVREKDLLQRLSDTPDLAYTYRPSEELDSRLRQEIDKAAKEGDSVGGVVTCIITGLKPGIGDPVYRKLSAKLAEAMMGINAAKGFEIGYGMESAFSRGSALLDEFVKDADGAIKTKTNHSGGIQGGISNGMPVFFNVYFKPTPTIGSPVPLMSETGETEIKLIKGRHDPCVAVRAVPVVKAMAALCLADFIFRN